MSTQPSLDFTAHHILVMAADPCEKRHRGNSESVAAHRRVIHTKAETYKRIMEILRLRGGATSKEIANTLGKQLNCVSPRISELKQMGWIIKTGDTRNGAAVLRIG